MDEKMAINESRFINVDFRNRKLNDLPIGLNDNKIPYKETAKYLGLSLDTKLKRKEDVKIET